MKSTQVCKPFQTFFHSPEVTAKAEFQANGGNEPGLLTKCAVDPGHRVRELSGKHVRERQFVREEVSEGIQGA